MTLIETTNISKQYDGREVLKSINLKINPAEIFTLIGPTGSGKTTLIKILDLLESPCSGSIAFKGADVTSSRAIQVEIRRLMSYVQQKPVIFNMNVFDNVACGLRWRYAKSATITRKTIEALELVGMSDYRYRNAKTLSGGETQRVAIARALVTEPEVLFLDEPTANMDPLSTAKIEEVLAHVIKEQKIAIIMTTHNMSQGQRMASSLGVMINGELLQTGSVNDIFNMPKSEEVARFVGIENSLEGVIIEVNGEFARISVNNETVYGISNYGVGEKVHVLIRPENITFSSSQDTGSARNVFKCRVDKINTLGSLVRIEVSCGLTLLGMITTQAAQDLNISIGKEIYASFKATAIHIIKRY